jgi:hypothetical protein
MKWVLDSLVKVAKSVQVRMCAGRDRHSEASEKLKHFCPKQVLEGGRLSCEEEEVWNDRQNPGEFLGKIPT